MTHAPPQKRSSIPYLLVPSFAIWLSAVLIGCQQEPELTSLRLAKIAKGVAPATPAKSGIEFVRTDSFRDVVSPGGLVDCQVRIKHAENDPVPFSILAIFRDAKNGDSNVTSLDSTSASSGMYVIAQQLKAPNAPGIYHLTLFASYLEPNPASPSETKRTVTITGPQIEVKQQ